ncbi:hypothetical protein CQ054_06690 [Ochrobactrum sp. MYb29]|nr:hypothetical protein CQ054_06690 [Ochrobactrum sp. MYb29]
MLSGLFSRKRARKTGGAAPPECLPEIGTIENPALFFDGYDLLLAYDIAPVSGGGVAILAFLRVFHFEKNPINVEGLQAARYPVSPWNFTEVTGSDRTERWRSLRPRFWTISFTDVTVEVVFSQVSKVYETRENVQPVIALRRFLASSNRSEEGS